MQVKKKKKREEKEEGDKSTDAYKVFLETTTLSFKHPFDYPYL